MKKIQKVIKENKGLTIILGLIIILTVFLLIIFVQMLRGESSDKYGNRLNGIDEVKISTEVYDSVKNEVKESDSVSNVEVRLQGKIVYTTIDLKDEVSISTAKGIANNTLDNYTEEQLSYYDFSFFLRWKGEEEDKVIIGNKHHNLDSISWNKN